MKKPNHCSLVEKHYLFENQNMGSGATLVFWKNLQDISSHCTQRDFFFPTDLCPFPYQSYRLSEQYPEEEKPTGYSVAIFSSLGKFCLIIVDDTLCFWWREVVIYWEFNLWYFVLCTMSVQKTLPWVWFESYYLRCAFLTDAKKEIPFTFF